MDNPDSVVTFVATYDRRQGYKRNLIMAYAHYVKTYGLTWTKPKYHENAKMPKIPQEHHIDLIMANSPLKLRTAIAISKDTGVRPIELTRMTLRNIDLTNGAVYPETAKHGSPRVLKLHACFTDRPPARPPALARPLSLSHSHARISISDKILDKSTRFNVTLIVARVAGVLFLNLKEIQYGAKTLNN